MKGFAKVGVSAMVNTLISWLVDTVEFLVNSSGNIRSEKVDFQKKLMVVKNMEILLLFSLLLFSLWWQIIIQGTSIHLLFPN